MKKYNKVIRLKLLFITCFFIFTSCQTAKHVKEDPPTKKSTITNIKKEENQQEKNEEKKTESRTNVATIIPENIELIDKPNLELILPEENDDDFDKPDENVDNKKLNNQSKKHPKGENKENIKTYTQQKQKKQSKQVEKKQNKKKVNSKITPATKNSISKKEKEPITKNYNPKKDIKTNKESKNISEITPEKQKTIMLETEPKDEYYSEFPNTKPEETFEPKISREVSLYKGQKLEVIYPGQGWVYLGETTSQKGIKYQQRKIQNGASIFHFSTEKKGDYILNFSYFDVLEDNFITDSLLVKVKKGNENTTTIVKAPDYKGEIKITETKKTLSSKKKDESKKNMITDNPKDLITTNSEPKKITQDSITEQKLSTNEALEEIRELIAEGKSKEALKKLTSFFENYSQGLDEALFLKGQAYELNGKEKNIKSALHSYQTLIKAYPDSKRWDDADARIRYIKKFYINID